MIVIIFENLSHNVRHRCMVLKNFLEIFSPESQKLLNEGNQELLWHELGDLGKKILKLASPEIIKSLFNAYAYKYEKQYAKAAEEFYNAIKFGCTSPKIYQCAEEMLQLSKMNG